MGVFSLRRIHSETVSRDLQEGGQILLIAFSCAVDSDWPDDITETKRRFLKALTNLQILAEYER